MRRLALFLAALLLAKMSVYAQQWTIVNASVRMVGAQSADNPLVPGVDFDSFLGTNFLTNTLGYDLALVRGESAFEETPPPQNDPHTLVRAQSFARALVGGNATQLLLIRYGADAHAYAGWDLPAPPGYEGEAWDSLQITLTLAITGGRRAFPRW